MAKVLLLYAHPGQKHSRVNKALFAAASALPGLTAVDLYATYPRFNIRIDEEQERLIEHDVIVWQYPLFWYSSPSLVKEYLDLVLEHGFAYGAGGTALSGKKMMLALSAAGKEQAYTPEGYQHFSLRTFLTPMEQTARLCHMEFLPPYVLYGALKAPGEGLVEPHVSGYLRLLESLRDDVFDTERAAGMEVLSGDALPLRQEA